MNNLSKVLFAFCWLTAFLLVAASSQPRSQSVATPPTTNLQKETLTNASVIELTQFGLDGAIIIEKIRQSECNFDTSLNGLKQLKAAKVSDAVIAFMMNPNAKPTPPTSPQPVPITGGTPSRFATNSTPSPNNNSGALDSSGKFIPLPMDKGAYLWDGKKLSLLIQSQVPSLGRNVGREALGAVVPFVKRKIELQLIGANAKANFDHSQPIILVSGLGDVIPGVPSYRLLYVKQGGMRKDRRILGTYDIGGFGSVAMVENEIPCEIKKVAEGIYAITPQQPLKDGEYGLVPITRLADVQANSQSIAAPPVWDFGIYAEGKPNVSKFK